jgi:leucyl/phenylalanyl-tRNA--protein transferase
MPVFRLDKSIQFPPVHLSESDGLLAIGGDLSANRLINAYQNGIFPWFNPIDPILWWAPDPRAVLFPSELKVHKSMRPVLNADKFKITIDQDFEGVINACKSVLRKQRHEEAELDEEMHFDESLWELAGQDTLQNPLGMGEQGVASDTWITEEMKAAYIELYKKGYAHSVEAWFEGELVGGLYGVVIGKMFYGESMFAKMRDASKAAFIFIVRKMEANDFPLIDCQIYNDHLGSLGAREIPRKVFLEILSSAIKEKAPEGFWT